LGAKACSRSWLPPQNLVAELGSTDGSEVSESVATANKCTPAIETTIDGDFNGWEGETLFKLSNGQIWQQVDCDYMYSYSYMPEVTIYSTTDGCKLKVEDESDTIVVKRIK
jgi:hypothetical protein